MKELEKLFIGRKLTTNGDEAYTTTGNKMVDILFMSQYYRNHLDEVPSLNKLAMQSGWSTSILFAMFMRDPRYGLGERDLGRKLLADLQVNPKMVEACGRYDDLLFLYDMTGDKEYLHFLINKALEGNELAKKWMPRLNSKNRNKALYICKMLGLSEKEYRKFIKVKTTESLLCSNQIFEIKYEQVPSLAMLKYFQAFQREDEYRFSNYLEDVKNNKAKMNNSTSNCYDVYKQFHKGNKHCQLLFDNLPQVNVGSILPIVDNSGSMYYSYSDCAGKAKAIGHYIAKNSTYMNNHIISFSAFPELIKLSDNYDEDMSIFDSYNDCSNTDFGAVMNLLSNLKEDFPDWLLVLSDMEFDQGSAQSKNRCMEIFRKHNAQTHIIWWNFNVFDTTVTEKDEYGNIYLSGYSPQLLTLLEVGFNQTKFLNKLLEEYERKINFEECLSFASLVQGHQRPTKEEIRRNIKREGK